MRCGESVFFDAPNYLSCTNDTNMRYIVFDCAYEITILIIGLEMIYGFFIKISHTQNQNSNWMFKFQLWIWWIWLRYWLNSIANVIAHWQKLPSKTNLSEFFEMILQRGAIFCFLRSNDIHSNNSNKGFYSMIYALFSNIQ